jgi:Tol biopolymer transport system component/predicted Ser/Thr protein kinase
MIGKIVSHYTILEKLGEGGMGVVYKALDTELDRTVALKFLPHSITADELEQARFLQEAKAASALNHPNICAIHTLGGHEGERFIDMEFVEGKTLREIVPVKKTQEAITYAIQIAEALQEAHAHGIVHRDIKADNIMVNTKNQVKVMDFGLAKLKGSLKLTKTSSTIGTLAYMAPEQIQGEQVDARADIFSFGIVLYEMLTGHLPFRGEHEAAMVYSIMNEEPESLQHYLPEAPSELLHILNRALEKNQEDRYQSIQEMLIDLRRLKKDSTRVSRQPQYDTPITGSSRPGLAREQKRTWRRRVWVSAGVIFVLCIVGVAYFLLSPHAVRLNPNRTTVALKIPFREISYHSLSRDGNWLAFPAADENGKWDVYLMNIRGDLQSRVTHEHAPWILATDISPDASQILYTCPDGSSRPWKAKVVGSQGGISRTLSDTGIARWSFDGTRIALLRSCAANMNVPSASGLLEIWGMSPEGTGKRLEMVDSVTTRSPLAFCWSPDGKSLTWVRNYPGGVGEVMVRELATGKERQLTFDKKWVDEVEWASNDVILFVSNRSGQANLWMVPEGGGEPTQVTYSGVPILSARISADNKMLVCLQQESIGNFLVSDLDGNNARQITSDDALLADGKFSPDGKHICYAVTDVDASVAAASVWIMDPDGKNRHKLTSGETGGYGCRWSPDGKWIAFWNQVGVYVIQPFNPGTPLLLGKGRYPAWVDSGKVVAFDGVKTHMYFLKGNSPIQIGDDSTSAVPIQDNQQLYFRDFRKGREGHWIVPLDPSGKQRGPARMILPSGVDIANYADQRFLIYEKQGGEIRRVSCPTGKDERIGKAPSSGLGIQDVHMDRKEILWVTFERRSKLLLIKNAFE